MAPDRGASASPSGYDSISPSRRKAIRRKSDGSSNDDSDTIRADGPSRHTRAQNILNERASEGHNFTLRGVLVGLAIGVVICFSNMYFGLQTGWVSSMAMPSALIGFAWFKTVARYLDYPFTPVENVLVQSVAGSVGTMPLGCGFVGVIPALNYMLRPEENGPLDISLWRLVVWAVGICFFGVVFAVPLRKEVIIREKLKFPSGTATALMIGVLHGEKGDAKLIQQESRDDASEETGLLPESDRAAPGWEAEEQIAPEPETYDENSQGVIKPDDWKAKIRLLVIAFSVSGIYTIISYFIPQLRDVPILGLPLAHNWLWTLNPSPAYVGQGIIMGPATTLHMLLGAVVGWGILSPLAKKRGWAPGPVDDWGTGSKGWIVWVSLAIMLADSLVSLGWLVLRPLIFYGRIWIPRLWQHFRTHSWRDAFTTSPLDKTGYTALGSSSHAKTSPPEPDAPPSQLISTRITIIGLILSLGLCILSVHVAFPGLIPVHLTTLALFLALLLSIMGVRALGETDLNPVSGISKLTQLLFALVTPTTGPAARNAVIVNLLAGALSESGALQAGDLLQDLKTGHLLGASPAAQFWGQIVGSAVGAVLSALVYKLYTRVYEIPGGLFQVPTGFVWVFTARLVTGRGLPPMVGRWAAGAGALFALSTATRVAGMARKKAGRGGGWWVDWVPGGIAVAVGMYNVPSFTLARALGGLLSWYWRRWRGREETPVVVLASGLILGEGLCSIVNLALASARVPHL